MVHLFYSFFLLALLAPMQFLLQYMVSGFLLRLSRWLLSRIFWGQLIYTPSAISLLIVVVLRRFSLHSTYYSRIRAFCCELRRKRPRCSSYAGFELNSPSDNFGALNNFAAG